MAHAFNEASAPCSGRDDFHVAVVRNQRVRPRGARHDLSVDGHGYSARFDASSYQESLDAFIQERIVDAIYVNHVTLFANESASLAASGASVTP